MAKRSKRKKEAGSEVSSKAVGTSVQGQVSWFIRDWLFGLILVLGVILAYQPVWWAGFFWDDEALVTANPCIVGPLGLKEIWTTSAADICPLVQTTFWMEHALWGLAPLPYHLVNVLFHGAGAIVLWRVLRSLQAPGAWLGAALWALHPVQVESVAWISEMKNTQSTMFFLLSILFFVRWLKGRGVDDRKDGAWNYALTLLFAALAMASKSSTVVLPVILCLCAWWVEGRWQWRNVARVAPIFLMSIATSAVSMWTQKLQLAGTDPQWVRTWPERLVAAGDAVWFYLGKLVWPHPLITIYPRWQIDAGQGVSYLPLLAVILTLFLLWLKRESWSRPWFFVFAYFLVAALPVLGLVDNYIFRYSLAFDHLQYLASMGPLALAAAGMVRWADFAIPGRFWLRSILGAGVLLVLGLMSWHRAWAYESDEMLWTDTLAKNPNCWAGYTNLGKIFLERGQVGEAMDQFRKALEINPNYDIAHNNLGDAFLHRGQVDEAMDQFRKALEINPSYVVAHNNLGNALSQKGQVDEAVAEFQKALEINPSYNVAHNNLGNALLKKGQVDEAVAEYQKALEINPNFDFAHNNLGLALLQKGQVDEAMVQFQKALEINSDFAEAHNNLGKAFLQKGQVDEAMAQFQMALQINPTYAEAHNNFGNALLQKGQVDEAMAQFQRALEINPHSAVAHNNLGNAFLGKGEVDEAIAQYRKALEINPNYAEVHNNIGWALLQKGEVDEAISQYQKALEINPTYDIAQKNLAKARAMARHASGPK